MKNKRIALFLLALLTGTAAFAVFNEKDLGKTLSVLRSELGAQNARMEASRQRMHSRGDAQHHRMVDMVQKTNELALILYSQNHDFTFDVTYALKEATREYEEFNRRQMPFTDIITRFNLEIDRCERLIESLRRLPPILEEQDDVPDSISISSDTLRMQALGFGRGWRGPHESPFTLDSLQQIDRDSCLVYARNLLQMYKMAERRVIRDSAHYAETNRRLKETYDYSQNRYRELQRKIFIEGQDNYLSVLGRLGQYSRQAWEEAKTKYSSDFGGYAGNSHSEWRGPVVVGFIVYVLVFLVIAALVSSVIINLLGRFSSRLRSNWNFQRRKHIYALVLGAVLFAVTVAVAGKFSSQNFFNEASKLLLTYSWLLIAILVSMLIHMEPEKTHAGLMTFMPVILLGLIVITFRIIFIPNRLVTLILTPLLLIFFIWQARLCRKKHKDIASVDLAYSGITLFVIGVALAMAVFGYVLMSIQLLIWWLFQLTAIHTLTAIHDLLGRYEDRYILAKLRRDNHNFTENALRKGEYLSQTWFFDFVKICLVPVLTVISVPFCIYFAADVFDLTSIFVSLFNKPFFNLTDAQGAEILKLSASGIVVAMSLYFLFRYISYAGKALYKLFKVSQVRRESGLKHVLENQINLTLANNVIAMICWGLYVAILIIIFRIPMGALSLVAAGLAIGIGLALKDILNNFIYGLQLMSGRVRVGDMIECDGIRGRVDSISYQSTQIVALDESLISFTNTTLFNKNFKNLTRNSPYEFIRITVGISYGTDIEEVRKVIIDAVGDNSERDRYGRLIVEPGYGVKVDFGEFGESSVNVDIKQLVIVESRLKYIAETQEKVYNALNAAKIEIPFPQRDVHIIK